MGPIIIFDKSFLESLNPDESVWLDQFYLSNMTPLFFVETLADLEKEVRKGRTPESVVGNLAHKTPDYSSKPNVHHTTLIEGELWAGEEIKTTESKIYLSKGQHKELEGRTGVFFQPSEEEEALKRWQEHKFLEIERNRARQWREQLSNLDLEKYYQAFQSFLPIGRLKSLESVKRLVDFSIDEPDQEKLIRFGMNLIGITPSAQSEVIDNWKNKGKPMCRTFAPYFTHVISVDLFFYIAMASDLIGRGRASHKIDIAYLYYIPFCDVFTSNDKLHQDIVELFLRDNQTFVRGVDLKEDLSKLDKHYDNLPEDTKSKGITSFAVHPPQEEEFLTPKLWDKHMSKEWRKQPSGYIPKPEHKRGNDIADYIRRFEKEGVPVPERNTTSNEPEQMIVKRMVQAKKGKWNRFPPEVLNRRKKDDGTWENV